MDPRRTLAETYLRSRCLEISDRQAGHVFRFHPRCPWRDETAGRTIFVPALIAAFRNVFNDQVTGIHRIALRPDGRKIGRKMFGVVCRAAVKLDPVGPHLAIAEGIETGMSGRPLGIQLPVWVLGSVGNIGKFPVLDGVERLAIFCEAGKASADNARMCGKRWRTNHKRVHLIHPKAGADDLNTELQQGRRASA
ncbi:DUF7146 domain-containing protein [Roseibium salinum]|uniref:Toprim domain-containing protein n=2 Tax=Roseibium salinum TaxID=1604349 RepID=A0ABT3QYE8_9HYPH|nr:toprim domain-containing protein [Roseibium sp. DSM 29163]MCX2721974.1 toprim domain-containing protein [Roseibium sp. DSM 29163]